MIIKADVYSEIKVNILEDLHKLKSKVRLGLTKTPRGGTSTGTLG